MQLMKNPNQKPTTGCLLAALSASFLLQSIASAASQESADPALDGSIPGCAILQKHAQANEAAAQFEMGRKCEFGIDTRANPRVAAHWYRLAAAQGFARAEYSLGRLYFSGEGVRQDRAEAVKYFHRAAVQGYALAQHRLARAYELGLGVPQDLAGAHWWYSLAADANGLVSSQLSLKALESNMTEVQLTQSRARSTKLIAVANGNRGN
jgi:Sel1 repeat-containing protein